MSETCDEVMEFVKSCYHASCGGFGPFPRHDPHLLYTLSAVQAWSLSSFKVSRQLLTNDLNQASSVFLLMTYSTALTNIGLFGLTWRPS